MDDVSPSRTALGGALRAWRDRLSPSHIGLFNKGRRRAQGLRREELAALAGVSVDYLVRLEQGRSQSPSPQVVESLARALHLNKSERDHLYTVSGRVPPPVGNVSTHIPPGVQRLIARLGDIPLALFAADWTLVMWTPLWAALIGDPLELDVEERNFVRFVFLADGAPRPVSSEAGDVELEAALVSDLRGAASAYPHDDKLRTLIQQTTSRSPRFAELWTSGIVQPHVSDRKTIAHARVGSITLDCDLLMVPGADLKLVAYTAVTGSPDAAKIDSLRVLPRGRAYRD